MAEELYMSIKTDVKSATKDTQDYTKSLKGAQDNVKEINEQLAIQNKYILEQEKELLKLKQAQDAIPKGAWSAQAPKLAEDIKKLTGEIKGEKLALKDLQLQQREATTTVKEFNQAQKETGDTLMDDIKNFKVFGLSLNGISASFKKIVPAAKLAFSSIKAGLISTGIGAFVVALGSITLWFTKTKAGAEALTKIFAGFGAAISVIVDRITDFVSAVGKLLSGDISGGLSAMKNTFMGIGDEIVRETQKAVELKEALNRLADAERELNVETAKRKADIEELRRAADDMNLSAEERIEKLQRAAQIEQNQMEQRVANAAEAVRIQQEQMAQSKNMKEDLQALADLEINLANIRRESAKVQRTLQRKENAIRRQQRAAERAAHKRYIQRQNEKIRKQNQTVQEFNKLYQEDFLSSIKSEEKKEKVQAELRFQAREDEINETVFNAKKREKLLADNFTIFEKEKNDIRIKFRKLREEQDKQEAAQLLAREQENTLMLIKNERDRASKELDFQEEAEMKAIEGTRNFEEQKEAIEEKYRILRKQKKDQEAEEDKARDGDVAAFKVEMLAQGLDVFSRILDVQGQDLENSYKKEIQLAEKNGKSTEAIEKKYEAKRRKLAEQQKQVKIGMAVIDTYQSAVGAYASAMALPPPAGLVMAPISAALAVAAGLAIVAMIMKTPVAGSGGGSAGGGGGGGASAGGGGMPPAPEFMTGGFTLPDSEEPEPIKAFVVTDEMTSSQNQLANIRRRSTI